MISAAEWRVIKDILLETPAAFSRICTNFRAPKTLGLHNRGGEIHSGNFISAVRNGDCFLLVYDSGEKL